MKLATELARQTIIWSWICTGFAFLMTSLNISARILRKVVGADDILIAIALVIGIVLVCQTTWAIVDEGQAEHQEDLSSSQVTLAAKVCTWTVQQE